MILQTPVQCLCHGFSLNSTSTEGKRVLGDLASLAVVSVFVCVIDKGRVQPTLLPGKAVSIRSVFFSSKFVLLPLFDAIGRHSPAILFQARDNQKF